MAEFETVRLQHYLLYRENEIASHQLRSIRSSSDCKIDASAPIHQMVDETKKGSLDVFDPINLEFVDDISSFFRLMNYRLRSVP